MLRYKYPRTYHLPYSLGATSDDRIGNDSDLMYKRLLITEKLDGENTTIYSDGSFHARSLDGGVSPWQTRVAADAMVIGLHLPYMWRICAENLYAIHSIEYSNLFSYLYVFAVYDDNNNCLSYEDTINWCRLLNLEHVPVMQEPLYYNRDTDLKERVTAIVKSPSSLGGDLEGVVVRNADTFHYSEHSKNILKYVRKDHVKTDKHWTKAWKKAKIGGSK